MKGWLPRFDIGPWGGGGIDNDSHVEGRSLVFQWGPIFLELCIARVVK